MAPSRKRKSVADSSTTSGPQQKRRALRPRKDAIHPFTQLPAELHLRIFKFCDSKTLAAISLLSNHFRELSLRILWETQPVDTFLKNFGQLDEHDDLRHAVRHLAVRSNSTPNRSRMSGVTKRLLTRLPKNYLPGLTEFTIEYSSVTVDFFAQIMNCLATHKPRNFKTLNIKTIYKWSKYGARGPPQDPEREPIVFPKDLTTIRVTCNFNCDMLGFNPLQAFDANKDSVTVAEVNLCRWFDHFSMKQCPNVRTLYVKQDPYDHYVAEQLSKKFPNVERLVLNSPQCGVLWPSANTFKMMVCQSPLSRKKYF
ncbi:hypothetical protein ABW20_dc0105532 [Dactylellina cionopaga]|nr:hypothetical protein ABW20_dc0105532 [Dactylellina cionopaga]